MEGCGISIYANAGYKPLRKDPPKAQQVVTAKSPSPSTYSTARCLLVLGLDGLSPAGNECVGAFVGLCEGGGIVVVFFLGSWRLCIG